MIGGAFVLPGGHQPPSEANGQNLLPCQLTFATSWPPSPHCLSQRKGRSTLCG